MNAMPHGVDRGLPHAPEQDLTFDIGGHASADVHHYDIGKPSSKGFGQSSDRAEHDDRIITGPRTAGFGEARVGGQRPSFPFSLNPIGLLYFTGTGRFVGTR
jgi:hypothetical protein